MSLSGLFLSRSTVAHLLCEPVARQISPQDVRPRRALQLAAAVDARSAARLAAGARRDRPDRSAGHRSVSLYSSDLGCVVRQGTDVSEVFVGCPAAHIDCGHACKSSIAVCGHSSCTSSFSMFSECLWPNAADRREARHSRDSSTAGGRGNFLPALLFLSASLSLFINPPDRLQGCIYSRLQNWMLQ